MSGSKAGAGVKEPVSGPVNVSDEPSPTTLSQSRKWNTKNLGLRLASDVAAAASAAVIVAPIVTIIDRGIMENASGRNTLKSSLLASLRTLALHPQSLLLSKPFALVWILYGGTYLTSNILDTLTSTAKNQSPTLVTAGPLKFLASSTANISLCLFKDQAFARLFGPPGLAPRAVPPASFALFALRDCLTIFASFNIPPLIGPVLAEHMGDEIQKRVSGQTVAQFAAPAIIQLVSTPFHLLGLDFYNRHGNGITWADRWAIVKKNWGISAAARICRIVPAYGVGGVVNSKVRIRFMEKLA